MEGGLFGAKESECYYCQLKEGPHESEHFIRIRDIEHAVIYLHRDQSLPGRLVVASASHAGDIDDLPEAAYLSFMNTVRLASMAVRSLYPQTEKINLMLCGNENQFRHPHLHILPRHAGDYGWPTFISGHREPYWPADDIRYIEAAEAFRLTLMKVQQRCQ